MKNKELEKFQDAINELDKYMNMWEELKNHLQKFPSNQIETSVVRYIGYFMSRLEKENEIK